MGLFDRLFKEKAIAPTQKVSYQRECVLNSNEQNNDDDRQFRKGIVSAYEVQINSDVLSNLKQRYISFDVETTGLNSSNDRIIEVGAVLLENGEIIDSYESLIQANVIIAPAASAVNHITNAMLNDAPSEDIVYPELISFLGDALDGHTIICAHNAKFDMNFLSETLMRLGYDAIIYYVDTLTISRNLVKGLNNYKQNTVAMHFDVINENAHRAISDAKVCGKILWELLKLKDKEVEQHRQCLEKNKPDVEELEVCAFIQNCINEKGGDVNWLRYRKNSGKYVDVTCLYTFVKLKFSKKGKYIIISKNKFKDVTLQTEACTTSEGGTVNVRLYFSSPFDLEILGDYFYQAYRDCYKSMQEYLNMGNNARREAEQSIENMVSISRDEMKMLLNSARNREYDDPTTSITSKPDISRDDVVVNAIHNRCPLAEIKNMGNSHKGFHEGFPFWEYGEVARKDGRLDEAILMYDKARFNGYDAPALYNSYAVTYRKKKDYDNEIVIIEEYLSRDTYGKGGVLEARRNKAVKMLYLRQDTERKAQEKALTNEQSKKEKTVSESKQRRGRAIIQIMDDGIIMKEYDSIAQAVKETGVNSKSIRDAANGIQKHAGGFAWKYVDEKG